MLEVIGAGFGRTGTWSLKNALEQLGFGPSYHAYELMRNPSHVARWERVIDTIDGSGTPDWNEVFEGYRSTTDFPGVSFWRELVDFYPEAKVILTVRDPRRWFASVRATVLEEMAAGGTLADVRGDAGAAGWDSADTPGFVRLMARMSKDDGTDYSDESQMVEKFERHNADVQAYVPPERLLVFEVKQGWEPLCEFLGVDVPTAEFPRLNDSDSFKELLAQAQNPQAQNPPA